MKNRIEQLEIKNFKSLKHVKLKCKRINLFIGKPNVGKSNLLEALCLFIAPYGNTNEFLSEYIRYENLKNLFYDNDRNNSIEIITNLGFASIRFFMNSDNQYYITIGPDTELLRAMHDVKTNSRGDYDDVFNNYIRKFNIAELANRPFKAHMNENARMNFSVPTYNTPVKKYHFKSLIEYKSHFSSFLEPPFGINMFTILESNPNFFEEYSSYFSEYKLDLLLDIELEKIDIQKRVGNRVYKIPYSLTADTLRRYIFYLLAIETNKDSILLFEEPEAHCFPPYIHQMSQRVIDSETNQFFITTHSPFVLNTIIENTKKEDVAVFISTYKNYQTHIAPLTDKELSDMLNYGYDIFSTIK
ncbi:MAG: AAA family ATPase [Bacteroidia bacterium]